ncbi:hypothetical protein PCE1_002565 [Barthelona sp. PCE]
MPRVTSLQTSYGHIFPITGGKRIVLSNHEPIKKRIAINLGGALDVPKDLVKSLTWTSLCNEYYSRGQEHFNFHSISYNGAVETTPCEYPIHEWDLYCPGFTRNRLEISGMIFFDQKNETAFEPFPELSNRDNMYNYSNFLFSYTDDMLTVAFCDPNSKQIGKQVFPDISRLEFHSRLCNCPCTDIWSVNGKTYRAELVNGIIELDLIHNKSLPSNADSCYYDGSGYYFSAFGQGVFALVDGSIIFDIGSNNVLDFIGTSEGNVLCRTKDHCLHQFSVEFVTEPMFELAVNEKLNCTCHTPVLHIDMFDTKVLLDIFGSGDTFYLIYKYQGKMNTIHTASVDDEGVLPSIFMYREESGIYYVTDSHFNQLYKVSSIIDWTICEFSTERAVWVNNNRLYMSNKSDEKILIMESDDDNIEDVQLVNDVVWLFTDSSKIYFIEINSNNFATLELELDWWCSTVNCFNSNINISEVAVVDEFGLDMDDEVLKVIFYKDNSLHVCDWNYDNTRGNILFLNENTWIVDNFLFKFDFESETVIQIGTIYIGVERYTQFILRKNVLCTLQPETRDYSIFYRTFEWIPSSEDFVVKDNFINLLEFFKNAKHAHYDTYIHV